MWLTVRKSKLTGSRNDIEDSLLHRLKEVLPPNVKVTVLADMGFGDTALYRFLERELGFLFVVRFRGNILLESEGVSLKAKDWLSPSGRAKRFVRPKLTNDKYEVEAVLVVHAEGMKESWCLATSLEGLAQTIIKLYSRRFTIEESFRDAKDWRFGMGLSTARLGEPQRRYRMLLMGAMAFAILTLLGAAAEATGLDKTLNVSTAKKRQHSLFYQGVYFYGALPWMKQHRFVALMVAFGRLVLELPFFRAAYAVL